jgi:hypothetical protein
MYRAFCLLSLPLAILLTTLSAPAESSKAVKPFNVPCNTAADEDEPAVGDNGLALYFTRTKDDKDKLMFVRRRAAGQPWPSKASPIDDYVQNKGDIRGVCVTQGRSPHYLFFAAKDKEGKNFDLFVAVRQEVGRAWTAPTPVANVNTEQDEMHPWLSGDGKSLYFSRKTKEGWRVFVSHRTGSTGPGGWQEAEQVDLPVDFHHATLTPDGKTMYLQGPLEKGRWGLFTATRKGKGWSKPAPLEALNDSEGKTGDRSPSLTRDGRFLYFASDRPGGKGGLDVWGVQTAQLAKK